MKLIPLNLGRWPSQASKPTRFAIVNDADFDRVSVHRWHTVSFGRTTYARTNAYINGKPRMIVMHRYVLGVLDPAVLIDHRNTNGLDNRRRNLRVASKSQNAANSRGHRDRLSKYKGVSFEKFTQRWLVQLTVAGVRVFKARFDTEEQAAAAYRRAAKKHCGQFARQ